MYSLPDESSKRLTFSSRLQSTARPQKYLSITLIVFIRCRYSRDCRGPRARQLVITLVRWLQQLVPGLLSLYNISSSVARSVEFQRNGMDLNPPPIRLTMQRQVQVRLNIIKNCIILALLLEQVQEFLYSFQKDFITIIIIFMNQISRNMTLTPLVLVIFYIFIRSMATL